MSNTPSFEWIYVVLSEKAEELGLHVMGFYYGRRVSVSRSIILLYGDGPEREYE